MNIKNSQSKITVIFLLLYSITFSSVRFNSNLNTPLLNFSPDSPKIVIYQDILPSLRVGGEVQVIVPQVKLGIITLIPFSHVDW